MLFAEGAHRRFLARGIRIEGEDDFAETGVVSENAAQHLDVVDAERGAAGRDGGRDAGEVAGHDVGVAFDDDDLAAAGDLAFGEVESVEHLGLVVDGGLRRVQVFRAVVVVEELARAEADGLACDVADGPHEPAPEPVVDTPVAGGDETRGGQFVLAETATAQVFRELVPAFGREADAEVCGGVGVEAAFAEEPAADIGLGGSEFLREEFFGGRVRCEDARTVPGFGRGSAVFVVQREPDAAGETFDRLAEADVVHLLEEGVDVAAFAAAEAVVHADLRAHMEAGAAFVVERAEAFERADTGRTEADVVAHDVSDVGAGFDLFDVTLSNSAGHSVILLSGPTSSASRMV